MAINFTTFETTLQGKLDAVTDSKEMLLLGKAVESTIGNITVTDIQAAGATQVTNVTNEGNTQVGRVTTEGNTQVANVQAAAASYAALAGATFTGDITAPNVNVTGTITGPATFTIDPAAVGDNTGTVVIAGNLQVDGTTTTVNSTTLDVTDKNITVASGAGDSTTADGAGLTIDGAGVTFEYSHAGQHMSLNTGLAIEEIKEKVILDATGVTTSHNLDAMSGGVVFNTANATGNWAINIRGDATTTLDSILSVGQSITIAHLVPQGGTAYYNTAVTVDGVSVTPKWQGGSAPSGGNANSTDVYSYTVIKTAAATFTVLAAQTQFA